MQVDIINAIALDSKKKPFNKSSDDNDVSFKSVVDTVSKDKKINTSKDSNTVLDNETVNDIKNDDDSKLDVNSKEKLSKDTDTDKINEILMQIAQLLNSKIDLKDLLGTFSNKISDLEGECKKLNLNFTQIIDMLKNNIISSQKNLLESLLNSDSLNSEPFTNKENNDKLFSKIKSEFQSMIKDDNQIININLDNKKPILVIDSNLSDGSKKENSSSAGFNNTDEVRLKELTGDKNTKVDKVTSFMNMLRAENINSENNISQGDVTINRTSFTNDIIKAMKYMEVNNVKDLTVKVQPNNLGDILIKVTMENGVLKASVSASNKDTYSLLNSNISEIQNKLNISDIKIQNFTVNIYNEDTTFFKKESDGGNSKNPNQNSKQNNSEVDEILTTSLKQNTSQIESKLNIFA